MKYRNPSPTVNVIVENNNMILLVKRSIPPFTGQLALPGGYIEYGERVEDAAKREVQEETGLEISIVGIVGVYSDPSRNPLKHTISTLFFAVPTSDTLHQSKEGEPLWIFTDELMKQELAFDHQQMVRDFMVWKEKKETSWSSKQYG